MINNVAGMRNYMGSMNLQSMQQRREQMFDKLDTDASGGLDTVEFSEFAQKLSDKTGNTIDSETVFATYDADNDGALSSDELTTYMEENAPEPPQTGGMMNAQGMQPPPPPPDMFGELDSDSSGGIDSAEFTTFAGDISEKTGNTIDVEDVFASYDTDSDGVLNEDELTTYMEENAPPPENKHFGISAYSSASDNSQVSSNISSLIDLLNNQSGDDNSDLMNTYLTKLFESLSKKASNGELDSFLNITA